MHEEKRKINSNVCWPCSSRKATIEDLIYLYTRFSFCFVNINSHQNRSNEKSNQYSTMHRILSRFVVLIREPKKIYGSLKLMIDRFFGEIHMSDRVLSIYVFLFVISWSYRLIDMIILQIFCEETNTSVLRISKGRWFVIDYSIIKLDQHSAKTRKQCMYTEKKKSK